VYGCRSELERLLQTLAVERQWAIGLDSGCLSGGELTADDYCRERVYTVPDERRAEQRGGEPIFSDMGTDV